MAKDFNIIDRDFSVSMDLIYQGDPYKLELDMNYRTYPNLGPECYIDSLYVWLVDYSLGAGRYGEDPWKLVYQNADEYCDGPYSLVGVFASEAAVKAYASRELTRIFCRLAEAIEIEAAES